MPYMDYDFDTFTNAENIQRFITRLDQVVVDYESRWGVGRLEKIVSPELQKKWQAQMDKLNDAIQRGDVMQVMELVEGCIRGYKALEDNALALGYKHHAPDYWEVKHPESDEVYRIVKNNTDYDMTVDGTAKVFTLQEVARILARYETIGAVKDVFPDAKVVNVYNEQDFNGIIPF